MSINLSVTAQQLFNDLQSRELRGATLFMADSAYDDKKTYSRCIELGLVPLIAYNPRRSKIKDFTHVKSSNWRKRTLGVEGLSLYQRFYRDRAAVELALSIYFQRALKWSFFTCPWSCQSH